MKTVNVTPNRTPRRARQPDLKAIIAQARTAVPRGEFHSAAK